MIIDVHTHIGVNPKRLFNGLYPPLQSAKDLLMKMDKVGIDYAVTFAFSHTLYDDPRDYYENKPIGLMDFPYQVENQLTLEHTSYFGNGRLLPFVNIDPKRKVEQQIEQIKKWSKKYKIYGLKIHTKATKTKGSEMIGSPFVELAKELDLPMLFHSYMQDVAHPVPILEFALANPEIKVCVAHLGGGIKEFYDRVEEEKPDNLFIDISPFLASCKDLPFDSRDRGYEVLDLDYERPARVLEELIDRFGDHMVFASDEPFTTYINPLEPSLEIRGDLSDEVDVLNKLSSSYVKKIAEKNPQKFLGLQLSSWDS